MAEFKMEFMDTQFLLNRSDLLCRLDICLTASLKKENTVEKVFQVPRFQSKQKTNESVMPTSFLSSTLQFTNQLRKQRKKKGLKYLPQSPSEQILELVSSRSQITFYSNCFVFVLHTFTIKYLNSNIFIQFLQKYL